MSIRAMWEDLSEDECDYFVNNYSFGEKSSDGNNIVRHKKTKIIRYTSITKNSLPLAIRALYVYKDCILLGFEGIGDIL